MGVPQAALFIRRMWGLWFDDQHIGLDRHVGHKRRWDWGVDEDVRLPRSMPLRFPVVRIFITTALFGRLETEDQLARVLGMRLAMS